MELRFDYQAEQRFKMMRLSKEERELEISRRSVENTAKLFTPSETEVDEPVIITSETTKVAPVETTPTTKVAPVEKYEATSDPKQLFNNGIPDTKDEKSTLLFLLYGKNWQIMDVMIDVSNYEFKKDSKGNITDIYPKNLDKSEDIAHNIPDRYSLRYDANGNKTGETHSIKSEKYGNEAAILSCFFGIDATMILRIMSNKLPAIGEPNPVGVHYKGISDVKKLSDGKISEFYYNGERYMVRYDSNGEISKAIKQSFDEKGNVIGQQVDEYKNVGTYSEYKTSKAYAYQYDYKGNQISQEVKVLQDKRD